MRWQATAYIRKLNRDFPSRPNIEDEFIVF